MVVRPKHLMTHESLNSHKVTPPIHFCLHKGFQLLTYKGLHNREDLLKKKQSAESSSSRRKLRSHDIITSILDNKFASTSVTATL